MQGLDIDLINFRKMKSIDRDEIIYKNVLNTRKKLSNYSFHRKVQYAWLSALTTAIVFLGKLFINKIK